jgi:adenosine deaminase
MLNMRQIELSFTLRDKDMLHQFNASKHANSLTIDFDNWPAIKHHVHAEGGTLDPDTLIFLAKKNGLPIPYEIFGPHNTLKFEYKSFYDFLKIYDQATSYIKTPQDVEEVIYRYLKRCHKEGAIYVELMCYPDHVKKIRKAYSQVSEERVVNAGHMAKEALDYSEINDANQEHINYERFVNAIAAAIDRARHEFGIEARILMVLLRHNGPDACNITLQEILSYRHPYVVGIHLAGDEVPFPSSQFRECYSLAEQHGLKLAAHVGEHSGPEFIRAAINDAQKTLNLSCEEMINIIKNSIYTSFAEPTLKDNLLAHVELFEAYQQLYRLLKHEPNSKSYNTLLTVKSICSHGMITELEYYLNIEFTSGTLPEMGRNLLKCYQNFKLTQETCLQNTLKSCEMFALAKISDIHLPESSKSVASSCMP